MNREEKIMTRVKEHYEEVCSLGFEVVAIFLQGSQNYALDEYSDEYQSDIDTKCIILPTLEDILQGESPYSSTHICENEEHIDIKDIRVMVEMFKRQNHSYIELLFTDYYYINPKYEKLVKELLDLADAISRMHPNQAIRALAGTSAANYKSLEQGFAPQVLEQITTYGYNPKRLHHILRINDFLKRFIAADESYKEMLIPSCASYVRQVKKGLHSLDEARRIARETDLETQQIRALNLTNTEYIDTNTEKALDALVRKFVVSYLRELVSKEQDC